MKIVNFLLNTLDFIVLAIAIVLLATSCTKHTDAPTAHYRYFFRCTTWGYADSITASVPSIFPNAPTHGAHVPTKFPDQVPGKVCLKEVLDSAIVNP